MVIQQQLNITDCIIDSPYFRDNLRRQEQQIASTKKAVNSVIEQCQNIITCTKALSDAYRAFGLSLYNFGSTNPENDEIDGFIKDLAKLISNIEDERTQLPSQIEEAFIKPLNRAFSSCDFSQEKKRVENEASNFQPVLNNYLANLDQKPVEFEHNAVVESALNYAHQIQSFQLFKRYEFLDALVCLVNHQMNFYHLSYEMISNSRPIYQITSKLQNIRTETLCSMAEAETKKEIILANPIEFLRTSLHKSTMIAGYLYLMKKALFGSTWVKCFCEYQKTSRKLFVTPSEYFANTFESERKGCAVFIARGCYPCEADEESNGRPFAFKVKLESTHSSQEFVIVVFQAQGDGERRLWLDAMIGCDDGDVALKQELSTDSTDQKLISENGYHFLETCFQAIEKYSLGTPGLYRVPAAKAKIAELMRRGLRGDFLDGKIDTSKEKSLQTICSEDVKVVTSTVQAYISSLNEPLTTYDLYDSFLYAASLEDDVRCIRSLHFLVHRLPPDNFRVLKLLFCHLSKLAANSDANKMTASNLGICFGPSLFRQRRNVWTVDNVKFTNRAVVVLIEHFVKIFGTSPPLADIEAVCQSWRICDRDRLPSTTFQTFFLQNQRQRPSRYLSLSSVFALFTQKVRNQQQQPLQLMRSTDSTRSVNTADEVDFTAADAEQNRRSREEAKRLVSLLTNGGQQVEDSLTN